MYIANVSEDGFENNPYLDAVRDYATGDESIVIALCNQIESEIAQMKKIKRLLAEMNMEDTGLDQGHSWWLWFTWYADLLYCWRKEVRAWTVAVGATAPQAAGVIHTDFERGFIRAEVIAYDDFYRTQWWKGAAAAGKSRLEGKTYIVQDGDVMHFRFNNTVNTNTNTNSGC